MAAGERYGSEREMPFVKLAGIALNVLALIALQGKPMTTLARHITAMYQHRNMYEASRQLEIARDFSFSAIWIVYGAALMVAGFWKRSAFIRWQAMVLLAVTIGKVFLYDSRELQQIYRILSFIALGVMLMAVSYAYHRDWFKLSPRKAGQHGAGDGMMKIAAALLAAVICCRAFHSVFQVSKAGAGAAGRSALCGGG